MYLWFFVMSLTAAIINAQDCRSAGKRCVDHEQCCGGCCINGECIDTYRSCLTAFDVCKEHVCVGDESCVVYSPPECPGCEPMPLCRVVLDPYLEI